MLNINNKLRVLFFALIALHNSLLSTNLETSPKRLRSELEDNQIEPPRKKQKKKIIITRDMAINIGKFLPGDNQFLNQLVRAYPAENVTYNNIAQKLIEKKLLINNDKNISSILDKHFKTSRISYLKPVLRYIIDQIEFNNYIVRIEKQQNYLKLLLSNKPLKYLTEKKLVLDSYKSFYREVEYILNHQEFTKEQLEYYKEVFNKIIESVQILEHIEDFVFVFFIRPNNISFDSKLLIGLASGLSSGLSVMALATALNMPQYTVSEWINLGTIEDFLSLGLVSFASGVTSILGYKISIVLAQKLLDNRRQKLYSISANLVNKIQTLNTRIQIKINQLT